MKKTSLFLAAGICFALSACGTSKPTNFYQLGSVPSPKQVSDNRKIIIGVETVSVAGYIDRPQIVTLKDVAGLDMSEFNRWAEPLEYSVQRVIAENISKGLKNGMAKPAGIKSSTYDYMVIVELNKFDGKFGDKAVLDAWWSITKKDSQNLVREHSSFSMPLGDTYEDLVEKQNQLLGQLSSEILAKIKKM